MFAHILSALSLFVVVVNSSITCDHSSACEDTIGSVCNHTTNHCECRPEFDVKLGERFCLKSKQLSQTCYTSDQCLSNSKCISNSTQLLSSSVQYWIKPGIPLFPEGVCLCPPNYYQNKFNVCEPTKPMGKKCDEDIECQQPNGICNLKTHSCRCNTTFIYSTLIGHCVKGKYLGEGCTGREECQYSEEHSWCIDGICLCGAGYTPDKSSYNGMRQCILDSMLVEKVDPQTMHENNNDSNFDYMTLLLIVAFLIAFIIAIFIARRNRNSIMQMIRPSNELNRTYCDQSHVMIPIDNTINSISSETRDNCKTDLQSTKLLPNISIELQKNY